MQPGPTNYTRRRALATMAAASGTVWTPLAAQQNAPATYNNPVLAGDHPDAGAIRVGDDYYLTHTGHWYAPSLLIWHSRNLVDWEPVTYALKRYYGGVWAPWLDHYDGKFYIYFPMNGRIWVVLASDIAGPWSEPVELPVGGIDPAHIVTPDGRRMLYVSGGQLAELNADGLSVKAPARQVFQPWPIPENWRIECECLEAPKVFFRNGFYYLTVAQGGTSGPPTSHMVVSARSRNPEGPWEYSPFNPIVRTASRFEKWWSQGHGRLVEAADSSWWMTLHAYDNGFRSLGRQTLLLPVEWTKEDWYRIPQGVTAAQPIRRPAGAAVAGSMRLSDDFTSAELGLQWQFWKDNSATRFQTGGGRLVLNARGQNFAESFPVTCIPGHRAYEIEVDVETDGCEAGLALFYNEARATGLQLGPDGIGLRPPSDRAKPRGLKVPAKRAALRLVNDSQSVDYYFRLPDQPWAKVRSSFDVSFMETNALGDFLNLRPALFAYGAGKATFRNFRYTGRSR